MDRSQSNKILVRPILDYVSPVWSPYTKSNIHRIEKVQRRAVRWTICRFSSYDSVTNMLGDLGWRSPLRIGVLTLDYVCFRRLCTVLLQCHYPHMLCMPRCLHDTQHYTRYNLDRFTQLQTTTITPSSLPLFSEIGCLHA